MAIFISASQAKAITQNLVNESATKLRAQIAIEIDKATKSNKFDVTVYQLHDAPITVQDLVLKELRDLGYQCSRSSDQRDGTSIFINWREAK